jgi:hypothetical protein
MGQLEGTNVSGMLNTEVLDSVSAVGGKVASITIGTPTATNGQAAEDMLNVIARVLNGEA